MLLQKNYKEIDNLMITTNRIKATKSATSKPLNQIN